MLEFYGIKGNCNPTPQLFYVWFNFCERIEIVYEIFSHKWRENSFHQEEEKKIVPHKCFKDSWCYFNRRLPRTYFWNQLCLNEFMLCFDTICLPKCLFKYFKFLLRIFFYLFKKKCYNFDLKSICMMVKNYWWWKISFTLTWYFKLIFLNHGEEHQP